MSVFETNPAQISISVGRSAWQSVERRDLPSLSIRATNPEV
jgi:hypothetical protein